MRRFTMCVLSLTLCWLWTAAAFSQPTEGEPSAEPTQQQPDRPPFDPADVTSLNPQGTVLIEPKNEAVWLKCEVVLREGPLEMVLCKRHTKEHESIVAIDTQAKIIHAGLLAIGLEPGQPAQFEPEFVPPKGQKLDIVAHWIDADGEPQQAPVQRWVRTATRRYFAEPMEQKPADLTIPEESELLYDDRAKELVWFGTMNEQQRDEMLGWSESEEYDAAIHKLYKRSQPEQMDADFVFVGSMFVTEDGRQYYLAEAGNLICVANFADAIIDVATRSSSENDLLLYEPWTERIPPLGTTVYLELTPSGETTGEAATSPDGPADRKPE